MTDYDDDRYHITAGGWIGVQHHNDPLDYPSKDEDARDFGQPLPPDDDPVYDQELLTTAADLEAMPYDADD